MKTIFQPGDVVQLKSGGHAMTVDETFYQHIKGTTDYGDVQTTECRCVWHDIGGAYQSAVFRMVLLKEAMQS